MSILSTLLGKYGDDLAKGISKVSSFSDDFVKRYGDDIARAGADKSDDAMRALLTKRGNKAMVGDAFMTQADLGSGVDMSKVFREYGGNTPSGRKMLADMLTDQNAPSPMVGYHSVSTDKLKKALEDTQGQIVNPSLQIVDPKVNPGKSYGDIILLGDKDMYFNKGDFGVVDTWGKSNAYTRDIYSPRVPEYVEKNGTKYIKGTRKEYTPRNISEWMNKQGAKASESSFASPGSVASANARRFKNISDILESQGDIGTQISNKKAFDDWGDFLYDEAEKVRQNSGVGYRDGNKFAAIQEIIDDMQTLLNGKKLSDDFYGLTTGKGAESMRRVREAINNLPTDYFEAKVNRPLELKEFSGAILPKGYNDEQVLGALKDAGVRVLGDYKYGVSEKEMYDSLQDTLKNITKDKNRFTTPYMLGTSGVLGGGAILSSLLNNNQGKES